MNPTDHIYALGGPPLFEDAAHAVQVMEKYGVTVDRIAPAGHNGIMGDLGDLHNPSSAGVISVRHVSRLVYQERKS